MANPATQPQMIPQAQPIIPQTQFVPANSPGQLHPVVQQAQAVIPTDSGPKRKSTREPAQVRIYSHSSLFHWWPVWVVGYIMAFVTFAQGQKQTIGGVTEWFSPNSSPGVIFFLTLFLVILLTNVTMRGKASGMAILSIVLATTLLAYFNMWDMVLRWLGGISVHLNLGAYLWFSTLMFTVWLLTVFVFDHMSYWRIRPGQITRETMLGTTSKSYDTDGMMLEKDRNDLFRHWILGLGAGDLRIITSGVNRDQIDIKNVLFVGSKIGAIQRLIAIQPDEFGRVVLK